MAIFKNTHINTSCDVLFKTLVKVTWKWVIHYTADALKLLYRRQYRTRTLKNAKQKTKTLSSSKELTSWVKLQVEIFCKACLQLALQQISTCSLTHDVSSIEDDNIKCFLLSLYIDVHYMLYTISINAHVYTCIYTCKTNEMA